MFFIGVLAVIGGFFLAGNISVYGQDSVLAPGAKPTLVKSGFGFTEGPAVDAKGNVFFTDIPNQTIYIWDYRNHSFSVYRQKTGMANGLMFDEKGNLIACEMGNRRITLDDMKGHVTVLTQEYNGKKYNQPNDLWIDPRGGIYFSDPFYGRDMSGLEQGTMQVYYISPDRKKVSRVTHDLERPNGLIGTPDGKKLYIGDHGAKKTWEYTVLYDGTLRDKKLFCQNGSDGMTMDEKGNLYLTVDEYILVYHPSGMMIASIKLADHPTNMIFAGKDRKTLFITARPSVYTLEMAVKGTPAAINLAPAAPGSFRIE
ncbi:MAG: SMP-30/gluconolactonase/LRE family protein [Deltaproteobacteria bacterium]|nr:SMP-30/gluconolactonase/LRE family protein [Deltaproteobacteria bacterium]